jgi:hypothetical protein
VNRVAATAALARLIPNCHFMHGEWLKLPSCPVKYGIESAYRD